MSVNNKELNNSESLSDKLNNANIQISQLVAKCNDLEKKLENIQNSKKWKTINVINNIFHRLIPNNTFRYKIAKLTFKLSKYIIKLLKNLKNLIRIERMNHSNNNQFVISDKANKNVLKFDNSITQSKSVFSKYFNNKFSRWSSLYKHIMYDEVKIKPCDIVIPVFNAKDYVISCVESVIKYTDLKYHKLYLIDDASTDITLKKILDKYKIIDGINVIYNEQNLGFIKTINLGMDITKNDILILNSDTEVTSGWLDKIIIAAYSSKDIGTATPMTNNGTIVSIPNIGLDNKLPENIDSELMNKILEDDSNNNYLSIPTGVGYCMFIKRSIINAIGKFDEEYLEKGYFDENDFCNRVLEYGYRNILVDNTFIYHKGTMSFSKEQAELYTNKNKSIFLENYPYYDNIIENYYKSEIYYDLYSKIKEKIEYNQIHNIGILYIIHNTFDENYNGPPGGTEYHLADLVLGNRNQNVHVIIPSMNRNEILHKVYYNGICILRHEYDCYRVTMFENRNRSMGILLLGVIKDFNIGMVHIQHLLRSTFDIIDICIRLNIPYVITIHDTYYLGGNPHLKKINSNEEHINYLNQSYGIKYPELYIKTFKENVKYMFENAKMIYSPSDIYKKYYKLEFGENINIKVIHHGIEIPKNKYNVKWSNKIVILFIGAFWEHKGSKVIFDILDKYKDNKKFIFYLLGPVGDGRITNINAKNIFILGSYYRHELYEKIYKIKPHYIVNTAYWPESFCYTFSEAAITGVPIISSPEGAIVEREKIYGGVILTKDKESQSFIDILNEIEMDSTGSIWKKLCNDRRVGNIKCKDQMIQEYFEDYKKYIQ